jgi:hypothetical protein
MAEALPAADGDRRPGVIGFCGWIDHCPLAIGGRVIRRP